ncbi:MAG: response regulator [Calditrichaceae bacterium]|nr:response regulator [Calditrichaceae bacterium]
MDNDLVQNIMIVDDHPENLLVLENILEAPGLNFIRAESGEETLRIMLKQRDVALILLDVQMPGMDGFETASILRSAPNTKHIPIIFVTAISKEDKNVFKGYESGAVDYMFKPVDPDILKSKVQVFLELDRRKRVLEDKNIELHEAKKNTDKILANVRNGLFLLDQKLDFKPQYSAALERILLTKNLANTNFIDFLNDKIPDKVKTSCNDYLELIFQDNMPESTLDKLNPLSEIEFSFTENGFESGIKKILNFSFKRIYNSDKKIDEVIATVADVTEKIYLAKKLKESEDQYKKQMEMAFNILHVEPALLNEFMEGLEAELSHIDNLLEYTKKSSEYAKSLEQIFRAMHLVKGNASLLDLKFFVNQAHEFEEKIIEVQNKKSLDGTDFLPLVMKLSELKKTGSEINSLIDRIKNIQSHFRPKRQYESELFIKSIQNLVNNTAEDLNKKITLNHKDFDFELIPYNHRLLVREILIQLIRNAISHGIETPDERKKLKKKETGTLTLSSYEQNGCYGFSLKDDGKGLQIEQLKQKAVKSGKFKKTEIDSWSNEQIMNLIFLQGISTAKYVDQISGRGVGMAVIKEKIDKHDGQIEVNSQAGKFCEFKITFKKTKE